MNICSSSHCLFLTLNKRIRRAARTLLSKLTGSSVASLGLQALGRNAVPVTWAEEPGRPKPFMCTHARTRVCTLHTLGPETGHRGPGAPQASVVSCSKGDRFSFLAPE